MCDEVRGCRMMRGIFTEYVRYLTGRQQKPKRFFGADRNMTGADRTAFGTYGSCSVAMSP